MPDDWPLGEPLRVGQRIAFTGCDPNERDDLEARATTAGLRVVGSVSRRTALLVTDGSYDGQKAAAAAELGTRVVHPSVFELLLNHIQPWTGVALQPVAKTNTVATGIALGAAGPSADPVAECFERPSPATVRAWALANGLSVGVRGRVAAEIWDAYADAHRS